MAAPSHADESETEFGVPLFFREWREGEWRAAGRETGDGEGSGREALWAVEEGRAVGGESRERNRNRAVKGERCRRKEEREEESHRRVKGRSETHEAGVYWW